MFVRIVLILVVYVVLRIYISTLSSYGFYHGYNEAMYSLIARNYFDGSLWAQFPYPGESQFVSAPPLFSYMVYLSFKIFGVADWSARLVSILAEVVAVIGVYVLAKELYNERVAVLSGVVFLVLPWNVLWFGRVQTDPLMVALVTVAVACYVKAYRNDRSMCWFGIVLGLATFVKQPAMGVWGVVLAWSVVEGIKRALVLKAVGWYLVGLLPVVIWGWYSGSLAGLLVETGKTGLFADVPRVILFTVAGISPLIIAYSILGAKLDKKSIAVVWLILYGIFVLVRTPMSHEYYSLILMPPVAILAGLGLEKAGNRAVVWTVAVGVAFSIIMLGISGDLGNRNTAMVGEYLSGQNVTVFTHLKYTPQIAWYSGAKVYSIGDQDLDWIEKKAGEIGGKNVLLIDEDDFRYNGAVQRYQMLYRVDYEGYGTVVIPESLVLTTVTKGLYPFK